MSGDSRDDLKARMAQRMESIAEVLGKADERVPDGDVTRTLGGSMRRRRGFSADDYNGLATLSLVEDDDGVVRWNYQPPAHGVRGRRARRRGMTPVGGDVIHRFSFEQTPPNEVMSALEGLDDKLTPNRGLKRVVDGKLVPVENADFRGRVLLLIHGTFSKSDMFIDELHAIAEGKAFLAKAAARYEAILAFDHPTLAVSPWINALDLELALAGVTGPVDVVCHSRGGLVVAWWLRNGRRQVDNVVFVASPLEGTSLASPANLRSALDGLANIFKGLEAASALASTVMPFMTIATGLASVLGGVARLGARTPLADAAVAIVPGLVGQSRVGNNSELLRLHRAPWVSTPIFSAVTSNFEPMDKNDPWWKVWKFLSRPGDKFLNKAADAIFQDKKNDLVVDTQSMTLLCGSDVATKDIHAFGDSKTVHHCNYFRQPETVAFLHRVLRV
jgi:pimeloyl-ACP methyl ester carboxylesterase